MAGIWQVSLQEPENSPSICISTAVAYLHLLREQGCCLTIIRHHIGEISTYCVDWWQETPAGVSALCDPWVKDLCAKKEKAYSLGLYNIPHRRGSSPSMQKNSLKSQCFYCITVVCDKAAWFQLCRNMFRNIIGGQEETVLVETEVPSIFYTWGLNT